MKYLPVLQLAIFALLLSPSARVEASNFPNPDLPAKTIVIKHPAAFNANAFFSSTTVLMFEIYKCGTKEELTQLLKDLTKDGNVESCIEGPLTGDYQAFTLSLKQVKDKSWFVNLFKKAGLKNIKLNNNPVTLLDKL